MGVKRDNVPFAGVNEGTESPKNVAKAAKRTFAAVPDLLTLKQSKLTIHNCGVPAGKNQKSRCGNTITVLYYRNTEEDKNEKISSADRRGNQIQI